MNERLKFVGACAAIFVLGTVASIIDRLYPPSSRAESKRPEAE